MEKSTTDVNFDDDENAGEIRLVHAVIRKAVKDEKASSSKNPRFTADILANMGDPKHWIRSYNTEPFSFVWYCTLIVCRPDDLRKTIIDLRNRGVLPVGDTRPVSE